MRGIVVVGTGMAGSRLVSEVRARDGKSRVTVFGAEEAPPHDPSWYAGHNVTAHWGVKVVSVDRETRCVLTADGRRTPYSVLVLATGAAIELATDAGLHVEHGIVVDDEMRTDDPAIFAVGGCAQHDGQVHDLLASCREQAAVVADLITGTDPRARYRGSRDQEGAGA
ncbi:FAD-dependent oxidoreductase [Herbidospora sp. RD11066]